MLRRLVITLIGQYQSITSKKIEVNDATGKVKVFDSNGGNPTEYEWAEIDWENTGWTEIAAPPPP